MYMPREQLTERESKRLAICEKTIQEGLQTCFDTGWALIEIKDTNLYRENFDSFEEYCQGRFRIGKAHAYRLIASAEVKDSLEDTKVGEHIVNEAQARELARVPENQRVKVIKAALKVDENVTAKAIRDIVQTSPTGDMQSPMNTGTSFKTAPQREVIELDKEGRAIPPKILELWRRAEQESKAGLALISQTRSALRNVQETDDVCYREMNLSATISNLDNAYGDLKRVVPHAVCHICQGLRPDKCAACKGRGFVSKFFWDMCVPEEYKKLLKKK